MKAHMLLHVETAVHTMYPQATGTVWGHLESMFFEVSRELEKEKEQIFQDMYKDYINVLCGTQVTGTLNKEQRMMRGEIAEEVRKTYELFQRLLNGESLEDLTGKDDKEMAEEIEEDEPALDSEEAKREEATEASTFPAGNDMDVED
jgi:hypothetical protein